MSLQQALENGIKRSTYYSRIHNLGWSKERASTEPVHSYKGEYAVYKKGEIIVMGTAEECAEELGVTVDYIRWMSYESGIKRAESRKDPENATTAVKLDE